MPRLIRQGLLNEPVEAWATIDTYADREAADKARTRELQNSADSDSPLNVSTAFAMSEGIAASIVGGIFLGVLAVFIQVWTDYGVTIRSGICENYFWLSKADCCPGAESCANWVTWGEYFGGAGSRHVGLINICAFLLIGCMSACTAATLCKFYAVFAAGGGINEVKTVVSGHIFNRYFSLWTTAIKALSVSLSTSCGLAVGKEGPFVHIGAACGDLVSGLFPSFENHSLRRELIAAGAGAGVAAAFGAPVGGVIFAIEEISSIFSFRVMIQTLIFGVVSCLVIKQFDISHSGRIVQFSINFVHRWNWFELPLFALLGVFCGYIATFGIWLNLQIVRFRKSTSLRKWPITEVAVQIFVANIINYVIPAGRLGLLEVLSQFWNECVTVSGGEQGVPCEYSAVGGVAGFFLTASLKFLMNCFAVGTMVPTGVLVPSLAIGALYGRSFGLMVSSIQTTFPNLLIFAECGTASTTCVHPVAYAVVGGAAFLTGYTRMTVCLAVIMFELTGGLEYLVPVVVGIMCAKWAGDSTGVESCYEVMIHENKMPYIDPKLEFHHPASASDVLDQKKFVHLPATGLTIQTLNDLLSTYTKFAGFPVVSDNDSRVYIGYIWRKSIIAALRRCEASDTNQSLTGDSPVVLSEQIAVDEPGILDLSSLVLRGVIQVAPTTSVQQLLNLFKSLGSRQVIVTDLSKFVGIITKKDFVAFMRKIEDAEHGAH